MLFSLPIASVIFWLADTNAMILLYSFGLPLALSTIKPLTVNLWSHKFKSVWAICSSESGISYCCPRCSRSWLWNPKVLALMRRALPDLQQTRKRRVILDRPVCQHAFRKLLGLGAGRYSKLTRALTAGRVPLDGRCRPRADDGSNPVSSRKRSIVVEFLEELVHTVAEPMPEAAGKQKGVDGQELQPAAKFRRLRGRRPGQRFRRFPVVTDEQGKVPESQVMRLLPPGSFSDYHRLLLSKHPEERISLKLFCAVSEAFFQHLFSRLSMIY